MRYFLLALILATLACGRLDPYTGSGQNSCSSGGGPHKDCVATPPPAASPLVSQVAIWADDDKNNGSNNVAASKIQNVVTYAETQLPVSKGKAYDDMDPALNGNVRFNGWVVQHYQANAMPYQPGNTLAGGNCGVGASGQNPYKTVYNDAQNGTGGNSLTYANLVYHVPGGTNDINGAIDKNQNSPASGCVTGNADTFMIQVGQANVEAELNEYVQGLGLGAPGIYNDADFIFTDNCHTDISGISSSNYTSTLSTDGSNGAGINDANYANASGPSQNTVDSERKKWYDSAFHATHLTNPSNASVHDGDAIKFWCNQFQDTLATANVSPHATDQLPGGANNNSSANYFGGQLENGFQNGGGQSIRPTDYPFAENTASQVLNFSSTVMFKVHNSNSYAGAQAQMILDELDYWAGYLLYFDAPSCLKGPLSCRTPADFEVPDNSVSNNVAPIFPWMFVMVYSPEETMASFKNGAGYAATKTGTGCVSGTDALSDHGIVDLLVDGSHAGGSTNSIECAAGGSGANARTMGVYCRIFDRSSQDLGNVLAGLHNISSLGKLAACFNGTNSALAIPCSTTIGSTSADFTAFTHEATLANGPMAYGTFAPGTGDSSYTVANGTSDLNLSGASWACGAQGTGTNIPAGQGEILTP